jgi:hypothetical protein
MMLLPASWVVASGRKPVCPSSFVVPEFQCDGELPGKLPPTKMRFLTHSFSVEKCTTRLCLLVWQ